MSSFAVLAPFVHGLMQPAVQGLMQQLQPAMQLLLGGLHMVHPVQPAEVQPVQPAQSVEPAVMQPVQPVQPVHPGLRQPVHGRVPLPVPLRLCPLLMRPPTKFSTVGFVGHYLWHEARRCVFCLGHGPHGLLLAILAVEDSYAPVVQVV